jgi:hypothetical protein
MGLFKNIKLAIAYRTLKQELSAIKRELKPTKFNFNQIRTVGILFDASNPEDFELVKRYLVYLRESNKKVKVLGFFSDKKIPELTYSKLEYDFFSLKELNWFGKPSTHIIENFINEEYDLLIDLNIHDHFPLKYIAALSKAKFKVGKYKEQDEIIYDMMIDSDNTQKLKYFLRQVDTYIAMLNKPEVNLN